MQPHDSFKSLEVPKVDIEWKNEGNYKINSIIINEFNTKHEEIKAPKTFSPKSQLGTTKKEGSPLSKRNEKIQKMQNYRHVFPSREDTMQWILYS